VTTLTEGTWLRVIMAILIVVSSGPSTGCERAEAAKPVATGPHEVKVIRYCFYWYSPGRMNGWNALTAKPRTPVRFPAWPP